MGGNIYDHLVATGEWGAKFRCTSLIIDIFKRRKIFFGFENSCAEHEILYFKKDVLLEPYTNFFSTDPFWSMGSFSYSWSSWGAREEWPSGVRIGRYSSIAGGCSPMAERHPIEWATTSFMSYYKEELFGDRPFIQAANKDFDYGGYGIDGFPKPLIETDISIGHDVWIAQNVLLAQRVSIGVGAVVAAGAIVTRDVDPYMIVGGVPARVIRPRFNEKMIERFMESKWWEFGPNLLRICDYKNPEKFLDDVMHAKEKQTIAPFCPEKISFRHILNDLMDRV